MDCTESTAMEGNAKVRYNASLQLDTGQSMAGMTNGGCSSLLTPHILDEFIDRIPFQVIQFFYQDCNRILDLLLGVG